MSVTYAIPANSIPNGTKRKSPYEADVIANPGQLPPAKRGPASGLAPDGQIGPQSPPPGAREATPNNNLFLGGLPHTTTEQDVRHLCSQWGGIVLECRVLPKQGLSGQKPASALCRMQTTEEAQAVLWHLSNNENGLPHFNVPNLVVRFANTKKPGPEGATHLTFRRPPPVAPRTSYPPPDLVYGQGPPPGPYGQPGGPPMGDPYGPGFPGNGAQPHPANNGGMAYPGGHAPPPDGYGPPDTGGYGPPDAGGFGPSNPSWQYPSPGGAPAQGMGPGHAQQPSYAPAPGPGLRSIYISGLPDEADELTLYRIFALYGAIESCKVLVDVTTKKCRGIGFVNYVNPTDAQGVVDASRLQPFFAGPKQLFIKFQGPEFQQRRAARPPM